MPDDELRRQDDLIIAGFDKRLALLEQAASLRSQTEEARARALEHSMSALAAKVDQSIALWQNVTAEPTASPAGRALKAQLEDLEKTYRENTDGIDALNSWRDEMAGSLQTLRILVLILGGLTGLIAVLQLAGVIVMGGQA